MTSPARPHAPEVVLHAERLEAGVVAEPVERVLVRRRITSYTRQIEVTLHREELELKRVPAGGGEGATTPGDGTPLVVVLSEEVPVVTVQTRPYERVTVTVDAVHGEQTVSAELSHEEVEVREG